jgi:octaprenyl-diphosphate synthase
LACAFLLEIWPFVQYLTGMNSQPKTAEKSAVMAESPLEKLAQIMDADMLAVNEAILNRMQSPVALIPQLAGYLIAAGGKRIRPLLTLAATQIYNGEMNRAHGLAAAVEFIHSATLLHDDVVDESTARRGQKTANLVFGNQASVLVGDFLFSRAFQLMVDDGSLDILRILSKASAVIAEGEVLQLTTTGRLDTSMDDYIAVITAKTAELFAAACAVGPVIAGAGPEAEKAMYDFGLNMGIAFQIVDDALDYQADQETLGKTVGDDFREGKMTAPVILALPEASGEERDFWQKALQDNQQTPACLARAQSILQRHNTISKALELARAYSEKAVQSLHKAPNQPLRGLLEETIHYTINRQY